MECTLSGNAIRGLHRAVTCLSRIGPELLIEAVADKVMLRSLNSARSAFLAITFKRHYFDRFQLSSPAAQCSVLLKAVCTVLRTQPGSIERLSITLPGGDATKLQFTLECFSGLRKTYWIACNQDVEMQHVAIEKSHFDSYLVARPRDFGRLLSNFQSNLQEITLIATEPSVAGTDPERKAVELRSYIDPVKDNSDGTLHTQLWIDPSEELRDYRHRGLAVDVTFSVKELKAFMAFCEGSEADMHLFFEKAGSPILLAPKFTLDDATNADFDATLILATMLGSQLRSSDTATQVPPAAAGDQNRTPGTPAVRADRTPAATAMGPRSDHTVIWSELSGSAGAAAGAGRGGEPVNFMQRAAGLRTLNLQDSEGTEEITLRCEDEPAHVSSRRANTEQQQQPVDDEDMLMQQQQPEQQQERELMNWISDDNEDGQAEEEDGFCVKSTPPHERGRNFP